MPDFPSLPDVLVGKTVKSVEMVDRDPHSPNLVISQADSQVLVLHFSDGTSLAVGSYMSQSVGFLFFKISDKT
jgi:hypothetical protein